MAKHKVITTADQIDRAISKAHALANEPRVISVEYRPSPALDLLLLKLSDGRRRLIPREDLEGLRHATRDQISHIEILGNGTGLHWPELDLDLYVPSLLKGIYGTQNWMRQIGEAGGRSTTPAKRKASQANGLKGGRPRRQTRETANT